MINLKERDADTILNRDIYTELISIEDELDRVDRENEIISRAKALGMVKRVTDTLKRYEGVDRRRKNEERRTKAMTTSGSQVTAFTMDNDGTMYPDMVCTGWYATDDGVFAYSSDKIGTPACYHPILPVRRLQNIETGEEQIVLAFKRGEIWNELTFPKAMIAKSSTITELSKFGISVNSENSRLLVRYLADLENWNDDLIPLRRSSSKLGWRADRKYFLPYDEGVDFDGQNRFMDLYGSVKESGSFDVWLKHMRELRASGSIEPRIALAASLSSVLLRVTGAQCFIVDFWGATEGGKTVTIMIAASVWADPADSKFIGDFKSTDVALETRCDMLNSLPMVLDDTSKASRRIRDNFEMLIYDICSGKGKSRSNKELGQARECHWNNVTICNGERPLSSYADQGGAINRIIEIECGEQIYQDPHETAELVKANYGHAGKEFVEVVRQMDPSAISQTMVDFERALEGPGTMQKQVNAMAAVLTADKIATEHIFKDGRALQPEDVREFLTDRTAISDGSRAYQFLLDTIDSNKGHFDDGAPDGIEQWGVISREKVDDDIVSVCNFYPTAFSDLLERGGFERRQFISWAVKRRLLVTAHGRSDGTRTRRMGDDAKVRRVISLILRYDEDFVDVSEDENVFD